MQTHKQHLNTLNIIHWNCFKMTPNRSLELNSFIIKNQPDILSINELKLDQNSANYYLNFNNYTTIYKPRKKGCNFGGGVALIVKNQVEFIETNYFQNLNLEIAEIKIKLQKEDCIIISYYNPPDAELSTALFNALYSSEANFILCGDLNAKAKSFGCSNAENKNGKILENILINTNCQIINEKINTYHRVYNNYTEMLDLLICSPLPASTLHDYSVLTT